MCLGFTIYDDLCGNCKSCTGIPDDIDEVKFDIRILENGIISTIDRESEGLENGDFYDFPAYCTEFNKILELGCFEQGCPKFKLLEREIEQ